LLEIRFHGRGGQGAVIASTIFATALFDEGKNVQAFPYFGVERRGAPVTAFLRMDDRPVRIRSEITEPDLVVVLDTFLMKYVNVALGLKPDGRILINSPKKPEMFKEFKNKVATVDATGIALKHGLGSKMSPIVNTAIIGAMVKLMGIVKLESVLSAIKYGVPVKKEENAAAAKEAYERLVV
jgi:2-oxoacid:acceptor oxidoreductase gamma subunit (pyruvate/2-ketoisovalerate family)